MSKYMKFKRGNAVIVGKRVEEKQERIKKILNWPNKILGRKQNVIYKQNKFVIDGVLVYDSYCLSSGTPYLLQVKGNLNAGETIYICGHGNEKYQTISGYTMKEIAEMLCQNYKYSGLEEIVIMSCYAASKNKYGKDMADLLLEELNQIGLNVQNDVKSVCKYTSIVIDFFGNALVMDKYPTKGKWDIVNENRINNFYGNQSKIEKELHCKELYLDTVNYQQQMDNYKEQEYVKEIAGWNYKEFFNIKNRRR